METRANYVIVGIFTIVAVLAAFGFVYWTANVGGRGETALLRIRIPGSASGLGRGSAVLFNGVKVGDITRVYLDVNKPTEAIADAQVDRLTPITKSTQADIGIAGLTGQANVDLKGAKADEPNLLAEAEDNGTVAVITANPSAVTNLLETAQDIFTRADKVMAELEGFARDSRPLLTGTFDNAKKFSDALARNADGVDKFLDSVSRLSEELAGVSGKLDGTLKAAEGILNSVDRDRIKEIVANADDFTRNLKDSSDRLEGLMKGVDTAVASVNTFAASATQTLAKADGILDGVDPEAVKSSLADIRVASENARKAVEDVTKVTSRFGDRADDIDDIISDAGEIADRLNKASVRVDGVLAKLDSLLGSGEAEGVMADASATLKEFRKTAEILNSRIGVITDNLAHFSGPGLSEVQGLVRDSRRSVERIERAITDLERNPQRIITGGEGTVRQYDGRMRR
jgi:phospholipid/cholesterol/gamma-HCH transport system substrate-binding protein